VFALTIAMVSAEEPGVRLAENKRGRHRIIWSREKLSYVFDEGYRLPFEM
jgi:hypothetical protein